MLVPLFGDHPCSDKDLGPISENILKSRNILRSASHLGNHVVFSMM